MESYQVEYKRARTKYMSLKVEIGASILHRSSKKRESQVKPSYKNSTNYRGQISYYS